MSIRGILSATTTLLVLALTTQIPAALATTWNGKEVEKNGVTHIMNPSTPIEPPVTVELEELWRLGGDTESDEEFFGVIGAVALDDEENVYLLDRQLSEVKVFSGQGEYLRTIGREGEGPGEFRRPSDLFFTPQGDLAVLQMAPGKLVLLTPEGDPAGDFIVGEEDGGFRMLRGGRSAGEHMVLAYVTARMEPGKWTQSSVLATYDADGTEGTRYYEGENTMNFANPIVDERKGLTPTWALGPGGTIYLTPTFGEYKISMIAPDGTPERIVERDYESLRRTDDETEAAKKRFIVRGPVKPKIVVAENHPDINRLFPRKDGTLWVLTSRGIKASNDRTLAAFDVFDAAGRFTHKVTLEGEGNPEDDAVFLTHDRVFVVTQFVTAMQSMHGGGDAETDEAEPEPMEVICYRLGLGGDVLASGGAGR
jgi:hypothetical protein